MYDITLKKKKEKLMKHKYHFEPKDVFKSEVMSRTKQRHL